MDTENNNYSLGEVTLSNGIKILTIQMEDKSRYLIATFLSSDIQGANPKYALDAIDSVLMGDRKYAELNGNVCGVEVYKETTTIYDNLAEDGKGDWCTIKTKNLRELIISWYEDSQEFTAKQK